MNWSDLTANATADVRRGAGCSMEEIAVAKLVTMPFVLTLVVLIGWMLPLPALFAMLLFVLLMVPVALWNAGWRQRTLTVEAVD